MRDQNSSRFFMLKRKLKRFLLTQQTIKYFILIFLFLFSGKVEISCGETLGLMPTPQKVIIVENPSYISAPVNDWSLSHPLKAQYKNPIQYELLMKKIGKVFKLKGSNYVSLNTPSQEATNKAISIKLFQNLSISEKKRHGISSATIPYDVNDSRFKESYVIDICKDEFGEAIVLCAGGEAGLWYALLSAEHLLQNKTRIRCMKIIDYPDMSIRGAFFNLKHFSQRSSRSLDTKSIKAALESYESLKLNTYFFSSGLFYSMDQNSKQFFIELFSYCKNHHIEPVPVLGSKLWDIPREVIPPEAVEGYWVRNENFFLDKENILKPLITNQNVIKNGSFENIVNREKPTQWSLGRSNRNGSWKIVAESNSIRGKNHVAEFKAYHLSKPYRFKLQPCQSDKKGFISVLPSSYYELGFSCRRSDQNNLRLRVSIRQFDQKFGQLVKGGNNLNTFHLRNDWQYHWQPVFTEPECSYIQISFMPDANRNQIGKISLDDIVLRRMNGELVNVIHPEYLQIINLDGTISYQAGRDYTYNSKITPEYKAIDSKAVEKTQLKAPRSSRIKLGQTVQVSYDVRTLDYRTVPRSKLCPSSFATYRLYRKAFANLIHLDPQFIHISMDEHHGGFNRDSRCLKRNMANGELYARMINNLNKMVHVDGPVEVLPGKWLEGLGKPEIRLIMWDDMANPWHNGNNKYYQNRYGVKSGKTYLSMPDTPLPGLNEKDLPGRYHISNDIIMASWWYKPEDVKEIIRNSPAFFENRNFNYIGCAWQDSRNIRRWSQALNGKLALGLIAATWNNEKSGIPNVAEYSWNRSD